MTGRRQLTLVAVLVAACFLPGEPSGTGRVTFELDFAQPYRVPLAGAAQPAVKISADGRVLSGPNYHLESLDPGVVQVDPTGRGLAGVARGTASVRVVYETATTGAPDTTFAVQVVVSRVAVNSATLAFTRLADTSRLAAAAYDAKDVAVSSVKFTWSSAEPHVASVDTTGLVRALNEGTVAITAEADSVTGSSSVSVTQVAAAVRMVPKVDTLRTVSRSTQFLAVALDDTNGVIRTAKPHWTSSDENIARIDTLGRATATGAGTTKIIARVGSAADTATMVVAQVVRFFAVTPSFDTLTAIADTVRHRALAFDSLNFPIPTPTVAWTTGDTAVATVDPMGLVRATKTGVALITASAVGRSAFATVVVLQQVKRAQILPHSVVLTGYGDTVRLGALALDRNGYPVANVGFTWGQGSGCVATVDNAGLVTARGAGSTGVIAIVATGGPPDTAAVTVTGATTCAQAAIAFRSERGIEVMREDGSERKVLIDDSTVAEPAWSPDGTRLAFTRTPDSWLTCEIYVARADGSEAVRLTSPQPPFGETNAWCAHSPAWSPDGTEIAFGGGDFAEVYNGETFVFVASADASGTRRLFGSGQKNDDYPTWSPDGTKIAFATSNDGIPENPGDIYLMRADGGGAVNLTPRPGYGNEPAWSPLGSQLAFASDGGIWSMNPDGSGRTNLTAGLGLYATSPAWSPDGAQIVFVGAFAYSHSHLYVINRDGTGLRQLTFTPNSSETHPSWRRVPARTGTPARRMARPVSHH
jgi:Tol biopolymer transport system component/uncharacterized protein YjdB